MGKASPSKRKVEKNNTLTQLFEKKNEGNWVVDLREKQKYRERVKTKCWKRKRKKY